MKQQVSPKATTKFAKATFTKTLARSSAVWLGIAGLVFAVAASSDEAQPDRPPVSIGGPGTPDTNQVRLAPRSGTPTDPLLGDVLWDNGLSFLGGLSHLSNPDRRSILDDFQTNGASWIVREFRTKFAWSDGSTGTGIDTELTVYGDIGGEPDFNTPIHFAENRVYNEVRDPENPLAAIFGAQVEVLIPLAIQRVSGSLDVEGLLGDRFGLLARKCRSLCF